MKSAKWLTIVSLFILTSWALPSEDSNLITDAPELSVCSTSNEVFTQGEEMVYKIYYNLGFVWIAAGEVVFRVHEDKGNQYHISAVGRTLKSYDWIFKVRDYYDSYIDKETMLPTRTIRKVHEGKYRLFDDVRYDRSKEIVHSRKGKTESDVNEEEMPIEACTHDILSSIYMMRNIDFQSQQEGTNLPLKIYLDRKIYPLDIVYKGKRMEKRIRGHGKSSTLLFQPEVVVGEVFKDNDGMKVWVSDDKNRIPLMIESPISVGSVKAVLKSHKGLKHPASY